MNPPEFKVVWDKIAKRKLDKICREIKRDVSLQTARHVRKGILAQVKLLETHPRRFPIDQYYENPTKEIRVVTKWSYRITYRIMEKEVRVILLCFAQQDPKTIKYLLNKL